MPVVDGIAATRTIAGWESLRPRVLVLTTFDLDDVVVDALELGIPDDDLGELVEVAKAGYTRA